MRYAWQVTFLGLGFWGSCKLEGFCGNLISGGLKLPRCRIRPGPKGWTPGPPLWGEAKGEAMTRAWSFLDRGVSSLQPCRCSLETRARLSPMWGLWCWAGPRSVAPCSLATWKPRLRSGVGEAKRALGAWDAPLLQRPPQPPLRPAPLGAAGSAPAPPAPPASSRGPAALPAALCSGSAFSVKMGSPRRRSHRRPLRVPIGDGIREPEPESWSLTFSWTFLYILKASHRWPGCSSFRSCCCACWASARHRRFSAGCSLPGTSRVLGKAGGAAPVELLGARSRAPAAGTCALRPSAGSSLLGLGPAVLLRRLLPGPPSRAKARGLSPCS